MNSRKMRMKFKKSTLQLLLTLNSNFSKIINYKSIKGDNDSSERS